MLRAGQPKKARALSNIEKAVSEIVDEMHSDGTLSELSTKWFGVDYTVTG